MVLKCPCGAELRVAGGRVPNPDATGSDGKPAGPKRYECHFCGKPVPVAGGKEPEVKQ